MSAAEKVELVRAVRSEIGLERALEIVGLARSTWYYRKTARSSYGDKYGHLRDALEEIARRHPEYGYRRATDELWERYGERAGKKVVQRLNRLWGLAILRGVKPPKPSVIRRMITEVGGRANLVRDLGDIASFEVVYTDFTDIAYAQGTAKLIAIIDHASKISLGWALEEQAVTRTALKAWTMARRTLVRFGRSTKGVIMHHDQDPVFTSHAWVRRLLLEDSSRVSYALNGAKDNPEMESFFSRFKNENRSLFADAADVDALRAIVSERMRYYNRERRLSALGNIAPFTFVRRLKRK